MLPGDLRLTKSGISNKGVRVVSTADVVIVILNEGTCSSYLSLPTLSLGAEYYVLMHAPSGGQSRTTMTIIATYPGTTKVQLTPPIDAGELVFSGFDLNNIQLNQYESFRLETDLDLSGMYVAGDHPVTLITGSSKDTYFGNNVFTDIATSQLPPVQAYGLMYHVFLIEANVKLLTDYAETSIAVIRTGSSGTSTDVLYLRRGGTFTSTDVQSNEFVTFVSNAPLLVVAYLTGSHPASLVIPPVQQYLSSYHFTVPKNAPGTFYDTYLYVGLSSGAFSNLRLDDKDAPVTDSVAGLQMTGFKIPLSTGAHRMYHLTSLSFPAYVIGTSPNDCTFAYPAGMAINEIYQVNFVYSFL